MAIGYCSWYATAIIISAKKPSYQPLEQLLKRLLYQRMSAQGFEELGYSYTTQTLCSQGCMCSCVRQHYLYQALLPGRHKYYAMLAR
jgi:hypothetical protein